MFTGNEKVWPFSERAAPAPRGHKVPVPGDTEGTKLVMDLLRDRVEEAGVEVRYETGATQLVVDESGAVVGLAWRRFQESGLVRAGAVVLAAGGFVMNADMVAEHTPALGSKLFTLGSTYDDGLGIRLGRSVGAELKHMDQPFITAPFYPPVAAGEGPDRQQARAAVRRGGLLPRAHVRLRDGAARLGGVPHRRQRAHRAPADAAGAVRRRLGDGRGDGGRARPAGRRRWWRRWRATTSTPRAARTPTSTSRPDWLAPQDVRPVGCLRPDPRARRCTPASPSAASASPSTARCSGPTGRWSPASTPPAPARRTSPRTARATARAPSSVRGRSSAGGPGAHAAPQFAG